MKPARLLLTLQRRILFADEGKTPDYRADSFP
jgi:hypothetical protein